MPSEEAKSIIKKLMDEKRAKFPEPVEKDPLIAEYRRIYTEREAVDNAGRGTRVPDRFALKEETADGVHGE